MYAICALGSCISFLISVTDAEIVTLDMSYEFAENKTIYVNTKNAFTREEEYRVGYYKEGFWLASYTFFATEHGGTHMDSPFYFAKNGRTMEEIRLSELLKRPAVKIDIAARAKTDPDTMITIDDLELWEKKHGRIPEGAAVLMYSGWHEKYGDWQAFLGLEAKYKAFDPTKKKRFHFPGFSKDAMDWLCTERNIVGVGVDTASIDHGPSISFGAHTSFASHDKWGLEMVANLKDLPESGALLSVLPMKIRGGTGAPSRIYATWNTTPGLASSLHDSVRFVITLLSCVLVTTLIRS